MTTSEDRAAARPRKPPPPFTVSQAQSTNSNDRLQEEKSDPAQAGISFYPSVKDAFPEKKITIKTFVHSIRMQEHSIAVARVRKAATEDEKTAEKQKLPAVQLSGYVTDGKRGKAMQEGRFKHSGWLQIDVDGDGLEGNTPEQARAILGTDPHVLSAFISPSGDGAKGIFKIPPCATEGEHKSAWNAVEKYISETYGLKIDPSTKDSARMCYFSSDKDFTLNESPKEFVLPEVVVEPPLAPATKTTTTSTGDRLVIRSEAFPEPPRDGINHWLPLAARWCESNGMSESEAIAKLRSYESGNRRPYSHNEPENACRKIYSTLLTPQATSAVLTLNGRPAIELPCPGRPLSDFAADVGRLLSGAGVYSRGGVAFTVDISTKQLCPVDPQWLRTWAESEIALFKQAKTSAGLTLSLRHSMSLDVAKALIVSPQFLAPLPQINRFSPVRLPVMRADGRIELLPTGFDPETLTLTEPHGVEYETERDPELGAKAVRGLLAEFPFADERSKAAAVAAMLTVYAGGLLPPASTTPAFIYFANAEGSGKTTLAQLAGIPYGVCEAESKPATEEEWQKTLLALVIGGARLLLLDNLKGHLDSGSFEAYLTATKFSGRLLGLNKKFSGDADAVVLLTGNRLTVSPDLRRRCIFIELFMQELRAEDRVFKRRLDAPAILEAQPGILTALWCMVKGWDAAGRPPASKINSSVPRWSETIAGIVEWAGFACPSVPADIEDGGDTDTRDIARLGEAMNPGSEMKFQALGELCIALGLFERFSDDLEDGGTAGLKARKGLSAVLKTYSGRMVALGKRFSAEGKGHQRRYVIR